MNMPRIAALAALLALALPLLSQDSPSARPAAPTAAVTPLAPVTVLAVRHAEKGTNDPRDPGLTPAGTERAEALAQLLAASGVTHIYSTPYRRTTATVAPLAEALGLEVTEYDPRRMPAFLDRLRNLPAGSVALVSGHSNTTPAVVLALGGELDDLQTVQGGPALGEAEYDRLFVLTLGDEDTRTATLELRYGPTGEH